MIYYQGEEFFNFFLQQFIFLEHPQINKITCQFYKKKKLDNEIIENVSIRPIFNTLSKIIIFINNKGE